ncbi:MAG: hypothetical protein HYT31_03325 [Parcubacteria group bacterium]|nr:hypothetical protein [Parcubacteria group bacterium]
MPVIKKKTSKAKRQKPVIAFRQSLFWDVDPKKIDPKKHSTYIIERILDFGRTNEVKWMRRYYTPRRISKVVKKSRVLHDKSRSLWSLVFR